MVISTDGVSETVFYFSTTLRLRGMFLTLCGVDVDVLAVGVICVIGKNELNKMSYIDIRLGETSLPLLLHGWKLATEVTGSMLAFDSF
ncbi:hypothetical protein F5146DRAFT_1133901 [Armillaria mellea]|nr:hypothetical protein F5146DRAFT_1133901 [Armillaria mellea]